MAIVLTDLLQPADETYPTLEAAMTAVVARYPQAVFSDVDFDHAPVIWVWPSNAASQDADTVRAVAWLQPEPPAC